MDNVMRSLREADIAYLEAANTIAFSMDSSDMDLFMESSDTNKDKTGFVDTIVEKIQKLVEKIKKFFEDLFSSAKLKSLKDKASSAFKNDKALEAKKVEVLDTGKIMGFSKKYKEKIKNAKSEEEIDQIVAEYNKKKKVGLVDGAATTIGLGVLAKKVLVPAYKNAQDKYIDNLRAEADTANNELADQLAKCMMGDKDEKDLERLTNAENKVTEIEKKGKNIRKQVNALNLMISDEMNAVKNALSSKISAISGAIKGVAGKVASKKNEESPVSESADSEIEGSLFAFEEGYQEFDESADDEKKSVGNTIREFIEKIIEKLKAFFKSIKEKTEIAKTKAILNSKLAKSTIMIKFKFRDKDITKYVALTEKAYNQYLVDMEKLTQKLTSGKLTLDDYQSQASKIFNTYYDKTYQIESSAAGVKMRTIEWGDPVTAARVRDYLMKLYQYQSKKSAEIDKASEKILTKLQNDAIKAAAEKKYAEEQAAAEKEHAAKVAAATKRAVSVIIGIIGCTAATGIFVNQLKKHAGDDKDNDFFEAVDELTESMTLEEFTEAAMV